jgi:ribonuclease/clavin/mitogillin
MREDQDGGSAAPFYESLLRRLVATPPPAPKIRASAAVVPWRRGERGELLVYWVLRNPGLAFMGGWHAFPGGGQNKSDPACPLAETALGGEGQTRPGPEVGEEELASLGPDLPPGLLTCAIRELFEETGLLLERGVLEGEIPADLEALREDLVAGRRDFAELALERGWRLAAGELHYAGRWLTPPLGPLRFDNRFFLLHWPAEIGLEPEVTFGELVSGEWIEPAAALAQWQAGEAVAAPPIVHILRVLEEVGPSRATPRLIDSREADIGPMRRIELRPGVVLMPLRTPTLPPAAFTNCFLLGQDELVLIDPATPYEDEQQRLLAALDALAERGGRIRAIWLTHHHADHIGAVEVCRRHLKVKVLAHPATAAKLEEIGIEVDGFLHGGERVELGGDPPFVVRVVHTPGHARGHLAFFDEKYGSLIAGDLMSTLSTIVIDPPEGDMDDYLESLEKVAALAPRAIFPSHGPLALSAMKKLEELHRHRLAREEKVLAAWQSGKKTPEEMVAEVYDDTPPAMHPVALRQIAAHLGRLEKLGRLG